MVKNPMDPFMRIAAGLLLALFLQLACPLDLIATEMVSIEISEKSAEKEIEKELDEDMLSGDDQSPEYTSWGSDELNEKSALVSIGHFQKIPTPPPEWEL